MDFTFLKRQLRTTCVHKRSEIKPDTANACAQEIITKFQELSLPNTPVFSAYWPMKTELDIRPLMHSLYEQNFCVCLPVVVEKQAPLLFRKWEPQAELVEGPYGTEQPNEKYEIASPNVLLLPLLAFDRKGGRLGYGGGFYDRTVKALRQKQNTLVIGVGFSHQEIKEVPLEETDEKVDYILTELEVIKGR